MPVDASELNEKGAPIRAPLRLERVAADLELGSLRPRALTLDGLGAGLIAMVRGFWASGTSRTRSMCSNPFSLIAPVTTTWSASWNRRSKARAAIP